MANYRTIKELVIAACVEERAFPSYENLTALVRQHFPTSKWQKTHYAWYKSKIKTGDICVPGVSESSGPVTDSNDLDADVTDSLEATVSLERDLHAYFASRLSELESGLRLVDNGIEYTTDAGRIDLLARDVDDNLVVVELKAGRAKDAALGQLLGYMGCLSAPSTNVRGLLVASSFEPRVVLAARGLRSIKLLQYELSFSLKQVMP